MATLYDAPRPTSHRVAARRPSVAGDDAVARAVLDLAAGVKAVETRDR
ncbi:MAG TPA: hypothetical protein VEI03_23920 [Stellaceae bacterium]|nr:hypothetical protein [Stellaceae bacterium]